MIAWAMILPDEDEDDMVWMYFSGFLWVSVRERGFGGMIRCSSFGKFDEVEYQKRRLLGC